MPDIGAWLGQHWNSTEHAVSEDFRWFGELAEHAAHPYPQAPAPRQSQEETMSVVTDACLAVETANARLAELAANPLLTAIAEAGLGLVLTPAEVTAVASLAAALEAGHSAAPAPAETQVMA